MVEARVEAADQALEIEGELLEVPLEELQLSQKHQPATQTDHRPQHAFSTQNLEKVHGIVENHWNVHGPNSLAEKIKTNEIVIIFTKLTS